MAGLRLDIALPRRGFELAVALEVAAGETVALVGPSGAGKTSVLRAVAGADRPRRGRIALGERVLFDAERGVDLPPEARGVGYVFQEYALFPHMTVRDNVAFAGGARADELLARLGIAHLAGRRPGRLSGGERQRVGLARALARRPGVLLLDEPMAALDPHTRGRVRDELRALLREAALPALLVTHDLDDATALADRIGVMVGGAVRRLGPPAEVLDDPADATVAALVGANVLPGVTAGAAGGLALVALDGGGTVRGAPALSGRVAAVVAPWRVALEGAGGDGRAGAGAGDGANRITAPVASVTPRGDRARVRVGPLVAEVPADAAAALGVAPGRVLTARFVPADTRIVPLGGPGAGAW
ncbi:ABC transporter ATP-binding protein [Miltoncostaea marina]|uniref:ABC transporter ATP-binding protein n=1 Tax=Miltoncostaea marina TaxID=2843215 RepID=UPI001C3CC748|nr:ABC transporter ATP-binding protein [Miltoncostaea marina]